MSFLLLLFKKKLTDGTIPDFLGPQVPVSDCCPGLVRQGEMVKDRVEGLVDFSGVENVFCSDMDIQEKYFSDKEWLKAGLFCAPADIYVDLKTVDSLISRDDEETEIFLETRDAYKAMIDSKKQDTILYYYNERLCVWERKIISRLPDEVAIDGYLWLIFDYFYVHICYATIAGAIRNGVAPW
jgi:hypothetical protein